MAGEDVWQERMCGRRGCVAGEDVWQERMCGAGQRIYRMAAVGHLVIWSSGQRIYRMVADRLIRPKVFSGAIFRI